jgi:hypothetical protein
MSALIAAGLAGLSAAAQAPPPARLPRPALWWFWMRLTAATTRADAWPTAISLKRLHSGAECAAAVAAGARGIQVVTTRESDATVEPDKRAEIANHARAEACLSLHASESGSGVHLFTSSLAPAQPARFAAWKTAQAAWVTRSLALAGVLNSALLHAGMSVTLGRTSACHGLA